MACVSATCYLRESTVCRLDIKIIRPLWFVLPPPKMKLYLALISVPAKLPSFSDLESRAGRQRKGEEER